MGKIPSGIEKGAVNWSGDFNQCLQVKKMKKDEHHSHQNNSNGNEIRFSGRYCSVYWSVNLPNGSMVVPLTQGICVPDSCESHDIQMHFKTVLSLIELNPWVRRFFEKQVKFTGVYCHPLPQERPWNSMAIFTFYLIGITFGVVVLATIFDVVIQYRRTSTSKGSRVKRSTSHQRSRIWRPKGRCFPPHPEDEEHIVQDDSSVEEVASSSGDDSHNQSPFSSTTDPVSIVRNDNNSFITKENDRSRRQDRKRNSLKYEEEDFYCLPLKLVLCFSLLSNTRRLLSNDENNKRKTSCPQIPCLNGIRVLSMTWVILCHSYLFSLSVTNNLVDLLQDAKDSFAFSVVINGSFSVDSFFVLSALLLAYTFLRSPSRSPDEDSDDEELRTRTTRRWSSSVLLLLSLYFHRILRILPVYIVVLLIDSSVAHLTSSGPFWDYGDQATSEHTLCHNSWWYNILFINNFQPLKEQCMAWTWYLANDMQYFILAPFLLLIVKW
jgi:hypothetical protein